MREVEYLNYSVDGLDLLRYTFCDQFFQCDIRSDMNSGPKKLDLLCEVSTRNREQAVRNQESESADHFHNQSLSRPGACSDRDPNVLR